MESKTNTTNTTQVQDNDVSIRELIRNIRQWYRYVLAKWKIILVAGVVGGAVGGGYAYFKKPVYTATCTFVLDEGKSGGGLNQYAGLAAMAGINIGGGASEGLFQGDNIMELYKSRRMLEKTLLSYGEFDGKMDLLINRYILINELREVWGADPKLRELSFDIPIEKFTRANDSVMTVVISDIKKNYLTVTKPDKKLNIIAVTIRSEDEAFAKEFNNAIVGTVNQFYVDTKTKKSLENLHILQRQADSIRSVLNASITGAASASDANPNANMALNVLRVPSQRKQIDVQANSTMYAEIVKNLEMAKLSSRQDAPLIQIVDQPVYPLDVKRLDPKMLFLLGALMLSGLVSVLILLRFLSK